MKGAALQYSPATLDASSISGRWGALLLPAFVILYIGVCSYFIGRDIIYLGDDIGTYLRFVREGSTWKGLPIMFHRTWELYNGRMNDMLAPVVLNLCGPAGRGIANAIFTILFFATPLFLFRGGRDALFRRMLFIALAAFTLPWDTLWMEFMCLLGYVWAPGFTLLMMVLILRGRASSQSAWRWLSLPFCLAAGWMHEALGFPLACGIAVYMCVTPFLKRAGMPRIFMAVAIALGGIFSLFSPSNFAKLTIDASDGPVTSVARLLLLSDYWTLALLLFIAGAAILVPRTLMKLVRSSWIIWAVAAIVSSVFLLAAGYGGRPGWHAQLFALIAIFRMADELIPPLPKIASLSVSLLLAAMLLFQYTAMTIWQGRLEREIRSLISESRASKTGTIFREYTRDPDLPWYLQRKLHCFPDEDDNYYRYLMSEFYARGKKITILPEAARGIDFEHLAEPVRFGDDVISPAPLRVKESFYYKMDFPTRIVEFEGRRYAESQFRIEPGGKTYYYYTPEDADPGSS